LKNATPTIRTLEAIIAPLPDRTLAVEDDCRRVWFACARLAALH
jgi:hypothetical protein